MVPWYAMFAGIFSYISYREYKGMFDEIPGKNTGKMIRISLSLSTAGILY